MTSSRSFAVLIGCALLAAAGCSTQDTPTTRPDVASAPPEAARGGVAVPRFQLSPEELATHVPGSAEAAISALEDSVVAMAPDSLRRAARAALVDPQRVITWTADPARAAMIGRLQRLRALEAGARLSRDARRAARGQPVRVTFFVDSLQQDGRVVIYREAMTLGVFVGLNSSPTPQDVAAGLAAVRFLRSQFGDVTPVAQRIPVKGSVAPPVSPQQRAQYTKWLDELADGEPRAVPGHSPRPTVSVSLRGVDQH